MNDFLTEGFFLVRKGESKDAFEKKKFKIINKKRLNIKNERKDTFSCSLKSISI